MTPICLQKTCFPHFSPPEESLNILTGWAHQRRIDEMSGVPPVRCENDWASLFDDTQDAVPKEASGFGVHPGGWLILQ